VKIHPDIAFAPSPFSTRKPSETARNSTGARTTRICCIQTTEFAATGTGISHNSVPNCLPSARRSDHRAHRESNLRH
jgi:hypothetical protein